MNETSYQEYQRRQRLFGAAVANRLPRAPLPPDPAAPKDPAPFGEDRRIARYAEDFRKAQPLAAEHGYTLSQIALGRIYTMARTVPGGDPENPNDQLIASIIPAEQQVALNHGPDYTPDTGGIMDVKDMSLCAVVRLLTEHFADHPRMKLQPMPGGPLGASQRERDYS